MENRGNKKEESLEMKSLIILYSYHNHNTEKIAEVFAKVLDAEINWPKDINPEEIVELNIS